MEICVGMRLDQGRQNSDLYAFWAAQKKLNSFDLLFLGSARANFNRFSRQSEAFFFASLFIEFISF